MAETFTARSPGRVNLIGEHTEYNGRMVLPAALSIGIEVSREPRADHIIRVASNQYDL